MHLRPATDDEIALSMQVARERRVATEIERTTENGRVLYRKRWLTEAHPDWSYWPQRENRILMRLHSHDPPPKHVVRVAQFDLDRNEIATEHAGATIHSL